MNQDEISEFSKEFEALETKALGSGTALMADFIKDHGLTKLKVACSLQREDIIIMHLLQNAGVDYTAYCLDTGRLHEETYFLKERIRTFFNCKFEVYFPESSEVEGLVNEKGFYSFKESLDNRKECCFIRKVQGNRRALAPTVCDSYSTGIRREQSAMRAHTPALEIDDGNFGLPKFNPLILWKKNDLEDYVQEHKLPDHPLYARGYRSIGCEPCTRAVPAEETDDRAGRWWWEHSDHKECGLHFAGK